MNRAVSLGGILGMVFTPKILLIDDDAQLGASIRRSFRKYDVDVVVATHGSQGIADVVAERPDLIITDLQMPYITGEKMIEFLAQNGQLGSTPVIVITGRWEAKITSRMRRCNVIELLQKPFESEQLIDAVQRVVELELREALVETA
ncbi:MAG: response regulator [Planctomycetota bacterium]